MVNYILYIDIRNTKRRATIFTCRLSRCANDFKLTTIRLVQLRAHLADAISDFRVCVSSIDAKDWKQFSISAKHQDNLDNLVSWVYLVEKKTLLYYLTRRRKQTILSLHSFFSPTRIICSQISLINWCCRWCVFVWLIMQNRRAVDIARCRWCRTTSRCFAA